MSKSPSSKILVVAANEFAAAVRTKAFLIGVLFTPALIAGMLLFQKVARNQVDTDARRFAVIDHSGQIFPVLAAAAQSRSSVAAAPAGAPVRQAVYQPVEVAPTSAAPEQLRVDLSEQIRRRQLYAFVEIPAGIDSEQGTPEKLRYHTDHTTDVELPRWIAATVTKRSGPGASAAPASIPRWSRACSRRSGSSRWACSAAAPPARSSRPARSTVSPCSVCPAG